MPPALDIVNGFYVMYNIIDLIFIVCQLLRLAESSDVEIALSVHHRVVLHSVRVTRSARVMAIAAMITMRSARKVKLILFAILTNIWLLLTLQLPYTMHTHFSYSCGFRSF